jgi:hypothetical protein
VYAILYKGRNSVMKSTRVYKSVIPNFPKHLNGFARALFAIFIESIRFSDSKQWILMEQASSVNLASSWEVLQMPSILSNAKHTVNYKLNINQHVLYSHAGQTKLKFLLLSYFYHDKSLHESSEQLRMLFLLNFRKYNLISLFWNEVFTFHVMLFVDHLANWIWTFGHIK